MVVDDGLNTTPDTHGVDADINVEPFGTQALGVLPDEPGKPVTVVTLHSLDDLDMAVLAGGDHAEVACGGQSDVNTDVDRSGLVPLVVTPLVHGLKHSTEVEQSIFANVRKPSKDLRHVPRVILAPTPLSIIDPLLLEQVVLRLLRHLLPREVGRVECGDGDEVPLPLRGRELRLIAPDLRHVRVRVVRVRDSEDASVLVRGDGLDRGEDVLRHASSLIDNGEDVGGVEPLECGLIVVRGLAPERGGGLEPGEGPLCFTCDSSGHIGLTLEILDI